MTPAPEGEYPERTGGAPVGGGVISIGEAAAILDEEFGDVSVSKLRYLEARGLITPTRTRGGSRRFGAADLARLRRILTLQRQDFLPLEVISDRLEAQDMEALASDLTDDAGLALQPAKGRDLGREEFVRVSGIAPDELDEMHRHGLISEWNEAALAIATIVHGLREYGIEPRHLRGIRQAVDRQASLIDASVPMPASEGSRVAASALEDRKLLAARLAALHVNLVRIALTQ